MLLANFMATLFYSSLKMCMLMMIAITTCLFRTRTLQALHSKMDISMMLPTLGDSKMCQVLAHLHIDCPKHVQRSVEVLILCGKEKN